MGRIEDLGLVVDKGLEWKQRAVDAEAERDQLRAEAERLRVNYEQLTALCNATEERERAALTTAAGLRRALEIAECYIKVFRHDYAIARRDFEGSKDQAEIDGDLKMIAAALAASPAEHAARALANFYWQAAESVPVGADAHDWLYMMASKYKFEADRLEVPNATK